MIYISVDLVHHEICHAKVGKGGINTHTSIRYVKQLSPKVIQLFLFSAHIGLKIFNILGSKILFILMLASACSFSGDFPVDVPILIHMK